HTQADLESRPAAMHRDELRFAPRHPHLIAKNEVAFGAHFGRAGFILPTIGERETQEGRLAQDGTGSGEVEARPDAGVARQRFQGTQFRPQLVRTLTPAVSSRKVTTAA